MLIVPSLSVALALTRMFAGDVNGAPAVGFVSATDGAEFAEELVVTMSCGLFVAASRELSVTNTVDEEGLRMAKLIKFRPALFSFRT